MTRSRMLEAEKMIKYRIGGWAGQGTVLAGTVLGKALSLEQGMNVVQKRSYSAAVRSGIAYSDVIASHDPVDELRIEIPDYLLVMYQDTLDSWSDIASKSQHLLVDSTRVKDIPEIDGEVYEVGAGDIAEEISSSKISNIVLLGALSKISKEVELDALRRTIKGKFPENYIDFNLEAVTKGSEAIDR